MRRLAAFAVLGLAGCSGTEPPRAPSPAVLVPDDPGEPRLRNVRKLTFGGENAEAYWSWDGSRLLWQVTGGPSGHPCDQIHVMDADGAGGRLVSTGLGRTTCGFFLPGDRQLIYASTHHVGAECPVPPKSDPRPVLCDPPSMVARRRGRAGENVSSWMTPPSASAP